MQPGFTNLPFSGTTVDGENFVLSAPLEYCASDGTRYRAVAGATTDGPSVPHWLESGLGRTGPQWLCGVLHDAAYRLKLEAWDGFAWRPAVLTKEQCDGLFKDALTVQGLPAEKALIFYEAVSRFGGAAFNDDRK